MNTNLLVGVTFDIIFRILCFIYVLSGDTLRREAISSLLIKFSIFGVQQDIESSLQEKKNSLKNSQMASNVKKWLFDKVHKKCDSASVLLMSFFLCYVSEKPINNMKVVSLATGSKCLGKSQIENKKGRLLFSLDMLTLT